MNLKIDLIEGTYSASARQIRAIRYAVVSGLPTTDPAAVIILALSAPAMPQIGDQHPTRPECLLANIDTISVEASDTVKIRLTYESPIVPSLSGGSGGSGTNWIIEDSTGLTTQSSSVVPGKKPGVDKVPLLIKFSDPKTEKLYGQDVGTINFMRPLRTVTLSGATKKSVENRIAAAVGSVNSDAWQGLPKGYWLLAGYESVSIAGSKTKTLRISLTTRNNEPWDEFIFFRDPHTGKPASGKEVDAAVTELSNAPYKYGISYPKVGNLRGVAKVCPYPDTSFHSIFGI